MRMLASCRRPVGSMSAQRGGAELERRAGPRSKLPIAAVGPAPIYVALEPFAFIGLAHTELMRNDDSTTTCGANGD